MSLEQHLSTWMPYMTALGVALWAALIIGHRRRIGRFLTSVEVGHRDFGGARMKHPTVRMAAGGRWAIWPVWDHHSGTVVRFEKRRLGWKTPIVEATLDEFNEYRRAEKDKEFPAQLLANPTVAGRAMLLEEAGVVTYERLFDQKQKELAIEYQREQERFWRRRFPFFFSAALFAAAVALVALLIYRPNAAPVPWVSPLTIAAGVFTTCLIFGGGIPRRPTRADAALLVLIDLELEKERRGSR